MPDWRYNVLSTGDGLSEAPAPAASYPRRAARSRPPHTCPYTTIFLGARTADDSSYHTPQPDTSDAYGDQYSVDHSSNLTDTSSFAHYEDCRPHLDGALPEVDHHIFPADRLETDGHVTLHVQKVPYTSSVFYVSAKNAVSAHSDEATSTDMYMVEGVSETSDALSSCTCDSFERCEFDCRDFEPFSDTCCCDPLSDGVCTRSPKEVDSPEHYCDRVAEDDVLSTRSDMEGLDLTLFEPAQIEDTAECTEDTADEVRAAPALATLCGVLYALPDTAAATEAAASALSGAYGGVPASWEPFYCVLHQERRTLTAYTSEELAVSSNNGDYNTRSLPRVRLDAGGNAANAGVRLRCWAAPPSITEEEAEDENEDDAASLRALPNHGK